MENVHCTLTVDTGVVCLKAVLTEKASKFELALPWTHVLKVKVICPNGRPHAKPTKCTFRQGTLRLVWAKRVRAESELIVIGKIFNHSKLAGVFLYAPVCTPSTKEIPFRILQIRTDSTTETCRALIVTHGRRLNSGDYQYAQTSTASWIFAATRYTLQPSPAAVDSLKKLPLYCLCPWNGSAEAPFIQDDAQLVLLDKENHMQLPFQFAVSPGARIVFVSPVTSLEDDPTLTDSHANDSKNMAFWKLGRRFSLCEHYQPGLMERILLHSAKHALELRLGPSDVIHLKNATQIVMVTAYPHARTLLTHPEASILKVLWLSQVSTFLRKIEPAKFREALGRFATHASDFDWFSNDVAIMNAALGMSVWGALTLDFFLEECVTFFAPPSEYAFTTVGRLAGNARQFIEPRLPYVVAYKLASKCHAIDGQVGPLVLPLQLTGIASDRTFPIHIVELFQPVRVTTIQDHFDRGNFLIPLRDSKVANKCGRAPSHKNLIKKAWDQNHSNFAHGIRLANTPSKHKFWSVQPPLAARSILVDPLYTSLMVPGETELATSIMLETVDAWRYSEELSGTILHVLAMIKTLCRPQSRKSESQRNAVSYVHVSAILSAIVTHPPTCQPPAHVALVRAHIIQNAYLPHLAVTLQQWMAESREKVIEDEGRFGVLWQVRLRLAREKDSFLVRGLLKYVLEMLGTAPFSSNQTLLKSVAKLIMEEKQFDEEKLGSVQRLKEHAQAALHICLLL
jgi:hypothetical protein